MYVPIPVVYLNLPEASVHHHYYGFYYKSLCHLQILREHYEFTYLLRICVVSGGNWFLW